MDHCEQCDFSYDELGLSELPDTIRSSGTAHRSRLETGVHDTRQQRLLRRRPAPQVWSALEDSCHVRDVLLLDVDKLIGAARSALGPDRGYQPGQHQ